MNADTVDQKVVDFLHSKGWKVKQVEDFLYQIEDLIVGRKTNEINELVEFMESNLTPSDAHPSQTDGVSI